MAAFAARYLMIAERGDQVSVFVHLVCASDHVAELKFPAFGIGTTNQALNDIREAFRRNDEDARDASHEGDEFCLRPHGNSFRLEV